MHEATPTNPEGLLARAFDLINSERPSAAVRECLAAVDELFGEETEALDKLREEREPLADDRSVPLEIRARRAWDGDPALRAEFGGNFVAWLSYAASLDAARTAAPTAA